MLGIPHDARCRLRRDRHRMAIPTLEIKPLCGTMTAAALSISSAPPRGEPHHRGREPDVAGLV
jgi:hypothetical protein